MRIRLLGTVSVVGADGAEQLPAGSRLRGLLARLALDAGRPVDVATLVDALWGGSPPSTANALQSLVTRLRRAVGTDRVRTVPGGYRLDVAPEAVDALRFAALRRAAAAAPDRARARELLDQALGLWSGPALADLQDVPFAGPAAARLAEDRASAAEELARRALDDGVAAAGLAALMEVLTEVLAGQPLRETAAVALARSLHAAGRRADALAVLDRTRAALADELGVDPGPELRRARTELLHDVPPPVAPPPAVPAVPAAGRHRTPALTSFVGREDDLARLHAAVATSRLVTVTGPGGTGKTRIVAELVRAYARPVAVVELAPLTGPDQVAATVLHAVGGPDLAMVERGTSDTPVRLRTALAGRELLLVLDNCEHLVAAAAELVHDLLTAAPRLTVLATSREPLGVPGEVLHPLGALDDAHAVRLFTDRARAARPDAVLDEQVIAGICRRLDGQPLPIELAAARIRSLSVGEIAERLADRFRLLVTGARTVVPRHQTLRAVVDWSWELLTAPERTVATRFGVFAGAVDARAVETVAGGPDPGGDPFDLLAALVEKSLVVAAADPDGGPTRYRMLETIREYAAGRLDESGEAARVVAAHARWVLGVLEPGEPELRTAAQLERLAVVRGVEGEAVRALERAVTGGRGADAHRLLAALAWSWLIRGEMATLHHWSDRVARLDAPVGEPAVATNHALRAMVLAGYTTTDGAAAEVAAVLALQDGLPRPWHPVVALAGPMATAFGDGDRGALVALADGDGDPWERAVAARVAAAHAENEGALDDQRTLLRLAHRLFGEVGDRFGLGMTVAALGELEDLAGNREAAAAAYTEARTRSAELGNVDDVPLFRMQLALLAARSGDADTARAHVRLAVEEAARDGAARDRQDPHGWVEWGRAEIERRLGRPELARKILVSSRELDGAGPGRLQREAVYHLMAAAAAIDLGELDGARVLLDHAADVALDSNDGPVLGQVAEVSARWALVAGDPERAGELLGVATARRGTLHLGDPEVVAVRDGVAAALGPDGAAAALARGREGAHDLAPRPVPDGAQVRRR